MDYRFGETQNNEEFVRTKGFERTALTGKQSFQKTEADCTITDTFIIKELYHETEDSIGNIYRWYFITNHVQVIDKTAALVKHNQANIDYLAMMTDIDIDNG